MKMWVMCRPDSACGPGDRATADRSVSKSRIVSRQRTTGQVDQVPHTEAFGAPIVGSSGGRSVRTKLLVQSMGQHLRTRRDGLLHISFPGDQHRLLPGVE
jgi:hypothetical protein